MLSGRKSSIAFLFGLSFYSFQNLENEISSRDALTKAVLSTGQKLVRGGHSASRKIMEQMKELETSVENLKAEAHVRRQRLMQSYEAHQFLTEVGMVHEEFILVFICFKRYLYCWVSTSTDIWAEFILFWFFLSGKYSYSRDVTVVFSSNCSEGLTSNHKYWVLGTHFLQ